MDQRLFQNTHAIYSAFPVHTGGRLRGQTRGARLERSGIAGCPQTCREFTKAPLPKPRRGAPNPLIDNRRRCS